MKKALFLLGVVSASIPTLFSMERINYSLGPCLLGGEGVEEDEKAEKRDTAPTIASLVHCSSEEELRILISQSMERPILLFLKKFNSSLEINKNETSYSISWNGEIIDLPAQVKKVVLTN